MVKILFIGDVVGPIGCKTVKVMIPKLKEKYDGLDLIIANAENSARGNGVSKESAEFLFGCGCNVLTGGNHSFRNFSIYKEFKENNLILRPLNFSKNCPGRGFVVFETKKGFVAIINLIGQAYLEAATSAFDEIKNLLFKIKTKNIFIDFHAEATGEKAALANFLDGKVSAVVGTHTHVQTSDARILNKGTGFLTDVGMVGPYDSVLGVFPNLVIRRITTKMPVRFMVPEEGKCVFNAVYFEVNEITGLCEKIETINEIV